ncbi:SDR family oxidoreductase [Haloglomus halophilum]|uniref:SDR family oxidoreductase n=1 Tax=Haloglomus halophilum TaxID=2962672 RepID=UPI0020C9CBBD|nr:SDR family oxidoreductase [Haloglomus halophilum]
MDLDLDGNAALVTAGSAGLGRASALALAAAGADVAVCGRTPEHLDEASEQLRAVGSGDVLVVEADITEKEAVEGFVERTVEEFGRLDHVVTSAGGPPSGPFLDTDDGDWYRAYDLLVMSAVWTTRAAYPHLADAAGDGDRAGENGASTIVNITSRSVQEVIDGLVLSNSVRRAVIGLMKTQAREFAPEVRVNAVLPGAHETDRIGDIIEQSVERGEFADYDEGRESWNEGIPLERMGRPEELGEAVAWLSSPASSYVNGTALPVDGGGLRSA